MKTEAGVSKTSRGRAQSCGPSPISTLVDAVPHPTKHMYARMSQRGISGDLVDLARQYGRDDQDKLILDRKGLRGLLDELRGLERKVIKALDKGGIVVVEAGGALITAYSADSYDRRRLHGHGR
jgi:hypothetical protein